MSHDQRPYHVFLPVGITAITTDSDSVDGVSTTSRATMGMIRSMLRVYAFEY